MTDLHNPGGRTPRFAQALLAALIALPASFFAAVLLTFAFGGGEEYFLGICIPVGVVGVGVKTYGAGARGGWRWLAGSVGGLLLAGLLVAALPDEIASSDTAFDVGKCLDASPESITEGQALRVVECDSAEANAFITGKGDAPNVCVLDPYVIIEGTVYCVDER